MAIPPPYDNYISLNTAEAAATARETLERDYEDGTEPPAAEVAAGVRRFVGHRLLPTRASSPTDEALGISPRALRNLSLVRIRELRRDGPREGGTWTIADRLSLGHRQVLMRRESLRLSLDPAEAVGQVGALFDREDPEALPPSIRLQGLISSLEDTAALYTAIYAYYESLDGEGPAFDYFIDELAELSLFSIALPFVSAVGSAMQEKGVLAAKVFALHSERKLIDALHEFTKQAIVGQSPDVTFFRSDTLPAMVAGLVVKEVLKEPLERIFQDAPLRFIVDNMESMVIALDRLIPKLFGLIEGCGDLKPLVQTTRVAPIQEYFQEEMETVIASCVYRGIVDMVFLRGLCPYITHMENQGRAQRVALAQFIMRFVNKQPYEDNKARLNCLMLKYQARLDALIDSFSRRPS
jgi:hypothetical protein